MFESEFRDLNECRVRSEWLLGFEIYYIEVYKSCGNRAKPMDSRLVWLELAWLFNPILDVGVARHTCGGLDSIGLWVFIRSEKLSELFLLLVDQGAAEARLVGPS